MPDALPRKREADIPKPPGAAAQEPDVATVVTLSDVLPERISWLWPRRAALGKITLVEGDPGLGKSLLTLELAACVSTGGELPGGGSFGPSDVVMMTAEDGLSDTIRPRLEAAGGDPTRIAALTAVRRKGKECFPSLLKDVELLEGVVRARRARLVVIDPLMAFLFGADAHKDQDVRSALAPVAMMAERTGAAVVVVRHLNKGVGTSAIYRGGGSIGIIGAARAGFLVARDPEDDARRYVACVKNNLAAMPPALAYRIEGTASGAARARFERRPIEMTADELLRKILEASDGRTTARREATDFLRAQLAGGKKVSVKVLQDEADGAGLSWRTVRRAQQRLRVVVEKAKGPNGEWIWSLRPTDQDEGEDAA